MTWLSQNWAWLLLPIILLVVMRGLGCSRPRDGSRQADRSDESVGEHRHGRSASESAMRDPVTGNPVSTSPALSSTYAGRVYVFEAPESKTLFDANPARYARAANDTEREGDGGAPRSHRRHGAC